MTVAAFSGSKHKGQSPAEVPPAGIVNSARVLALVASPADGNIRGALADDAAKMTSDRGQSAGYSAVPA